jgi:hypothetical protein
MWLKYIYITLEHRIYKSSEKSDDQDGRRRWPHNDRRLGIMPKRAFGRCDEAAHATPLNWLILKNVNGLGIPAEYGMSLGLELCRCEITRSRTSTEPSTETLAACLFRFAAAFVRKSEKTPAACSINSIRGLADDRELLEVYQS